LSSVQRCGIVAAGVLGLFMSAPAAAADSEFSAARVQQGASLYEQNCAPCHGTRMRDPNSAFDLRTFPADQKGRFVTSVVKGKNAMPPWGDLLKDADVEALWAYVRAGEK
jgi:mono/diheme cytochrome c family protein